MSDPRFDRDLARSDLDRDPMAQDDRRTDLDRDRMAQDDRFAARKAPGDSTTWIAAAVVALLVAGGIAYFAMGDRQTAGVAPDTTTGQATRPAPAPSPPPAPQR